MHGTSAVRLTQLHRNSIPIEDAQAVIRSIAMNAESEEEVVDWLFAAGFDGEAADIEDIGEVGFRLSVWGPHDEVIRV